MKKLLPAIILAAVLCTVPSLLCRAQWDKDVFDLRGRQALSDGKYSFAIENFNILTRLDTTDYWSFFFRGIAKYNLGDIRGSQKDFDRSVRINPVFTNGYHYRAIAESRLGEYDQALTDLQKAIDLRPGITGLYFSRGVTYFLAQRFKDVLEIAKSQDVVIQDRTILEGVHIFVRNNLELGNLSKRDYETYMQLFESMMSTVKLPDLLIYLKSSIPHLVANIQKRGREYEQSISLEYLGGLNDRYEEWISGYEGKLLVIDADELDFQNRPEDFALITDRIDAQLFGLFD